MKHTIILPDLGQTTSEAKVIRWLKRPGDKVSMGEPLLEVETDKASMEVEAYVGGYLREMLVKEGETANAMAPIAILTDSPDEPYQDTLTGSSQIETTLRPLRPEASPKKTAHRTVAAAPAARLLAKEFGIDLDSVTGTGPDGLITKSDVERFIMGQAGSKPAQVLDQLWLKSLSAMAAITAKSKSTIPHFYITVDVDVSAAEIWRASWNASHPDLKASANDVFVRAASRALSDSPGLNVSYQEGRYEQRLGADVLLVVALKSGLALVPFENPCALPWEEYLRSMRGILEKAEQGLISASKLKSTPLLAISNLGMFGVKQFAAIIPPGCTAILAIGSIRDEAIVKNKQVQIGQVCSLTLSADHRVIDGITAAKFLERMQQHLNSLC